MSRAGRFPISAAPGDLVRPQLPGDLVEHAVDVLEAFGAAETLRQFNRLVDDDPVGNFEPLLQLVGTDQQDSMLDRRQRLDAAIEVPCELVAERGCAFDRSAQQFAVVLEIGLAAKLLETLCTLAFQQMAFDRGQVLAPDQPLVKTLQRKLPGAPARTAATTALLRTVLQLLLAPIRHPRLQPSRPRRAPRPDSPSLPQRAQHRVPSPRRARAPAPRCRSSGWRWRPERRIRVRPRRLRARTLRRRFRSDRSRPGSRSRLRSARQRPGSPPAWPARA